MDCVLDLVTGHDLSADQIVEIHVRLPKVHLNNLMYHDPRSDLEAKFSLEFAVACLVINRRCGLDDFSQEMVMREDIRALYSKINPDPVEGLEGHTPTEVTIILKDGTELHSATTMPKGSKPAPFSNEEYWQKFADCTRSHLAKEQAARLADALQRFPTLGKASQMTAAMAVPLRSGGAGG
jgi:2-methylcitrate dehydratase PrpD